MQFTLFDMLINSNEMLSREQAVILAYNLICAVKFLHTCNIVHRDLKPENIMITEHMEVKIFDFGLSRTLAMKPKPGKVQRKMSSNCFTRYYRPPEVILSKPDYDESADLWSLGCLLSLVFQKTVRSGEDILMLFNGDSCFPMSPIEQSGESDQEMDKYNVSSNDHLLEIISGLNLKEKDGRCYKNLESYDYLKRLFKSLDITNTDLLEERHKGMAKDMKEMISRFLQFDCSQRPKLAQVLDHPMFKEIRQKQCEAPSLKYISISVDRIPFNEDQDSCKDYNSKQLIKYIAKVSD